VNSDWPVLLTAETVNVALALVSPVAETVIVPVPDVEGAKFAVAMPPLGLTGEAGLKDPETPLTENVIGFVADVTVLPLASWMVAVYRTAVPVWVLAFTGLKASFDAGPTPEVTFKAAVALVSPAALAVTVALPEVEGVKLDVALPPTAAAAAGLKVPLTPATEKLTVSVALVTVLPKLSWITAV